MAQISITIPSGSLPLVQVGDVVTFNTELVGVTQKPVITKTIQIAETLKFKPGKIFKHLRKNIGDKIYKGDVVATKEAVFATKKYIADEDGVLTSVNHHSGEIIIEHTSSDEKSEKILAMVEGTVSSLEIDKIHIKTSKTLSIELAKEAAERIGGKVVITDKEHAMQLTLPQVQGNIILSSDLSDYVFSKFEALGASHIIVSEQISTSSPRMLVLNNPKDMQTIIDFVPHAVYANASEKNITFYK